MYEFLEKNKKNILKNLQILFNNSRLNLLKIDELNIPDVTTEVSNLFKKIERNANVMFEGEIRSLAKSTGKDVGFFELDEYLEDYNPTLQYVYKNELERKKARYIEAILAIGAVSSLAMEELMAKNIRYMNTQIQETIAHMEFQGHLDAWEDDGVEYVIWHSEHDNKVCGTCDELDGQRFSIDDCPDLQHIGCRCWIEQYNSNSEENETKDSGAMAGALNNSNDPNGKKREAHAVRYYESIYNSNSQYIIDAISKNSGIDKKEVEAMYAHLFVNEYELSVGKSKFAPDYDIAESIRRLREGKNIQKHDIILVKHEAKEYNEMKKRGISYIEAHKIANKEYNYEEALYEWLENKNG